MQWKNVYIFISSTFNDMHAERDYLVKKVFPQLSAWCEERKLRLIDIDLRWGVSEADATENKRVVQVCLDRIDACRPFFLCFLGQRRGWVPGEHDINEQTYGNFPKLIEKHYSGNASVTEMEILHALIDPLHNGLQKLEGGGQQAAGPVDYAFFFLREPGYLQSIGNNKLLDIYTNRAECDPGKADAWLAQWREKVIPETGRPVYGYTGEWDETQSTHEIALPLCCPTTAPIGSGAWEAAFEKWARMWESVGVPVDEHGEITGPAERGKAMAYNESLTRGRLTRFACEGRELADTIVENLKAAIVSRFGERARTEQTPLQNELDQQARFLQAASEGFIEREGDFDEIKRYISGGESRTFAIAANAGMGKTSLIAHFIDTYHAAVGETLHYRFIGGSDDSVSVERLVRALLAELREAGKLTSDIPINDTDMLNAFPKFLAEAGSVGKTIIVIDALNQLETAMRDLSWIPDALPENVKLILSFKRGGEDAEEYFDRQSQSGAALLYSVKPFDSPDDRKKLVTAYLNRFFKELDEPRIQTLINSEGADNPLFLKIALNELRVFGAHNDLTAMIRDNFGNTPVSAFKAVLARLENDTAYSKVPPDVALPHMLGWLAHSKYGLSVDEIAGLMLFEKIADNRTDARDAVYQILRQLRPYFAKRDGRVDFFYESFKIAAAERYTDGHPHARAGAAWHKSLAEYFETLPLENRHRLMEQAWQYIKAGMDKPYEELLWDYDYIDAKLGAFDASRLLEDYALANATDSGLEGEVRESAGLIEKTLRLSRETLALYPEQLASQLWGRLSGIDRPEVKEFLQSVIGKKEGAWLRPVFPCMEIPHGNTAGIINEGAGKIAGAGFSADSSCLIYCHALESEAVIKIWHIGGQKVKMKISIAYETGSSVSCFRINADRTKAVTCVNKVKAGLSSAAYVHDLSTGRMLFSVPLGKDADWFYECADIGEDGRYLLLAAHVDVLKSREKPFGTKDSRLELWDMQAGACVAAAESLRSLCTGCSILSGNAGIVIITNIVAELLDFKTLDEKLTYDGSPNSFVLSADRKTVYLQDYAQPTICAREAATGKLLFELDDMGGEFRRVFCMSGDGRYILSETGFSAELIDAATGRVTALYNHAGRLTSAAFSPDNGYCASSSDDLTVRIWNLRQERQDIQRCGGLAEYIDISFDNALALLSGSDCPIELWDCGSGTRKEIFGYRGKALFTKYSIVFIDYEADSIAAIDLDTGAEKRIVIPGCQNLYLCGVSPDGELLLTWNSTRGGEQAYSVWSAAAMECVKSLPTSDTLYGFTDEVYTFSGGNRYFATSVYTEIRICDWQNGRRTAFHYGFPTGDFVLGGGDMAAFVSSSYGAHQLVIFDMIGRQEVKSFSLYPMEELDEHRINDKPSGIRGKGEFCICTVDGAPGLACTTSGKSRIVRLWDLNRESEEDSAARFISEGLMVCAKCSRDGTLIILSDSDGRVYFLKAMNIERPGQFTQGDVVNGDWNVEGPLIEAPEPPPISREELNEILNTGYDGQPNPSESGKKPSVFQRLFKKK